MPPYPPGDHTGRLVETVGMKGHRIGGTRAISPRHADFIVNVEDAGPRMSERC